MDIKGKRILSIVTYYTLIGLTYLTLIAFILAVIFRDLPMWAKIIYYAWAGISIGAVTFDIVCTANNHMKYISGFIIYGLSIAMVAMAVILYTLNMTGAVLDTGFVNLYLISVMLSCVSTLFMIATFIVGESVIEHNTTAIAMEKSNNRNKTV